MSVAALQMAQSRYAQMGSRSDHEHKEDVTDEVKMSDEPLPGGIYGMAIASIVRDSRRLAIAAEEEDEYPTVRCMRLASSILIVYMLISLQFWLTIETKRLVSPMSVNEIRGVYGHYEQVMYNDTMGVEHTYLNYVGKPRGEEGYFNASNFDFMSDDDKDLACMIPLSMPSFTLVILFIWAITCMGEIRGTTNMLLELWKVESVSSMSESLSFEDLDKDAGEGRLVGLTCSWRWFLMLAVLLPRFLLTCFLMWLGCRWLLATTGFSDLLLNAIALEFILMLNETIYNVVVPAHTKKETEGTFIPSGTRSHADWSSYFNTLSLALIAIVFVCSYFYGWQQVLPDYKWDVKVVCEDYLAKKMKV